MTGKDGIPAAIRTWIENLVRTRDPVQPIDRMFRHGRAYHEAALRCLELRPGHGFLFQPALVLFAFVIEIYLKTLLVREGRNPRSGGHALDKLFAKLADDTRTRISERYAERHDGQILDDDIAAYSLLFVELRYAYERDGAHQTDMSGVAQLASALYEVWVALEPDFLQAGAVHARITAPNQGIPIPVDAA